MILARLQYYRFRFFPEPEVRLRFFPAYYIRCVVRFFENPKLYRAIFKGIAYAGLLYFALAMVIGFDNAFQRHDRAEYNRGANHQWRLDHAKK